MQSTSNQPTHPLLQSTANFIIKWPPRLIVVTYVGYYSLGYAYRKGIMTRIDIIAIPILYKYSSTAGLGVTMPIFQKYSAWTVRTVTGITAGLIYDLIARIVCYICDKLWNKKQERTDKLPVPN